MTDNDEKPKNTAKTTISQFLDVVYYLCQLMRLERNKTKTGTCWKIKISGLSVNFRVEETISLHFRGYLDGQYIKLVRLEGLIYKPFGPHHETTQILIMA